jgi:chemotaxis protein MotB
MRLVLNLLVVVLALGTMQSCVSKKKFDELLASKAASDKALAETQTKVANLEKENADMKASLEAEKTRLNGEIANLRRDLESSKGQYGEVQKKLDMSQAELAKVKAEIDGIFGAYKSSGLSMEERNGRMYLVTSAPMEYKSGVYSLTRSQRDAVAQLATTLAANPKLKFLVEGNTDTDKVGRGAAYQDNWELSSKRALAICRELIKKGVNPAQIAAVGRGDTAPKSDNTTKEGKAVNRRTELTADPDVAPLLKKN